MPRTIRSLRARAAFTLTELLIAVGVLVVGIVAAAKIFSSASRVSAVAEANADLLATAAAIESQIRQDFSNIPKNTCMVIQQVEVNSPGGQQTLDPSLGTAEIRADQIGFFSRAVRGTQQYVGSQEAIAAGGAAQSWFPESGVARIYYGHGVLASTVPVDFGPTSYEDTNAPLVPWKGGRVETERWSNGQIGGVVNVPATKPSLWPLARVQTLMATDAVVSNSYATTSGPNATIRLFTSRAVRLGPLANAYPNIADSLWTSGRVDVVKWQPDDLFSQMAYQANAQQAAQPIPFSQPPGSQWSAPSARLRMIQTLAPWAVPATSVTPTNGAGQLYVAYPRVEKSALSTTRADLMLTAPVLAANCSSFKVEWTWANGVGRSLQGALGGPSAGTEPIGMVVQPGADQPWFGLDDISVPYGESKVKPLSISPNWTSGGGGDDWGTVGVPLVIGDVANGDFVCSVEGAINRSGGADIRDKPIWVTSPEQQGKRVYQAVFGFNQAPPPLIAPAQINLALINPGAFGRGPYTPFPSAVRITLRLHDPLGRIEGGREFQFIVDIPRN
ncbi:MAG: type II secretion system protein J [Planctomycetota bacterium]